MKKGARKMSRQGRLKTPMDLISIDWNEVWRETQARTSFRGRDPKFWDRRAPSFARHATKSDYIGQFLRIMEAKPHWSLLDVGCAAGTLAVPLAKRVNRITAMDASEVMVSLLDERCRQEGITNIRAVNGRWEDDWDELAIGVHDVAVASRSLMVPDFRSTVEKLSDHARERIYLSTLVGDGPHDRHILEAGGRVHHPGADYICALNVLYQMGIFANLTFTYHEENPIYENLESALDAFRWMLDRMTSEEEERVRAFLPTYLVPCDGGWKLPRPRVVRWAVLWWEKR